MIVTLIIHLSSLKAYWILFFKESAFLKSPCDKSGRKPQKSREQKAPRNICEAHDMTFILILEMWIHKNMRTIPCQRPGKAKNTFPPNASPLTASTTATVRCHDEPNRQQDFLIQKPRCVPTSAQRADAVGTRDHGGFSQTNSPTFTLHFTLRTFVRNDLRSYPKREESYMPT